ncbi:MAG: MBL fold metallo-hydrolase [Atopobiaceae bacterium]|nr:MBL fold metallo-hydrolase [Atopobiaceae bacterium]
MSTELAVTILVENTPVSGLEAEHGLSVHLRYRREGHVTNVLLDFGQSDAFARNASTLGVNLDAVDVAVLSHAHYDHADGMPAFFGANDHASLYLSEACAERCWSTKAGAVAPHYIGIARGLLARHADRMVRVASDHVTTIVPGVHLVPHTTPGLDLLGERAGMLLHDGDDWKPDDFSHEQTLVLELEPSPSGAQRVAVFNSCSHAGLPAIATEVANCFPQAQIAAYVGGLHLVHASEDQIMQVASAIRTAGIEHLHTGHCTGERATTLLQEALPGRVHALYPGATLRL